MPLAFCLDPRWLWPWPWTQLAAKVRQMCTLQWTHDFHHCGGGCFEVVLLTKAGALVLSRPKASAQTPLVQVLQAPPQFPPQHRPSLYAAAEGLGILLHLELYRTVPTAAKVCHCRQYLEDLVGVAVVPCPPRCRWARSVSAP